MMVRMSLIYMMGRYGASAVTLLALSLYTRLATPGEYGFYALVMALSGALFACFGQWLRQILLRFATGAQEGHEPLPSAILQGFLLSALSISFVLVCLSFALTGDLQRAVQIALPVFLAMGLFELALAWLQLQLRSGFYVGISLLRTSTAGLLGLLFLSLGYGAQGLILATLSAYIIAAAPIFYTSRLGLGHPTILREDRHAMLRYGFPLALSAAMGAGLALADRAIIAALLSTEAAGLYAAPYDLAMRTLQVLMLAINLAGTPLIIRAFEKDDAARTDYFLARQWGLLWAAGLPVTLIMAFMPHGIASLLLGPAFRDAGSQLMPLVAVATFLQGLESFYLSFSFSLSKRPLRQMLVLMVATFVNVTLTLILVPRYGIAGGAWATLASAVLAFAGSLWSGLSLRALPFSPFELLRITAAAAPVTMLLWWLDPRTPFSSVLAAGIALSLYACAAFALDVMGARRQFMIALRTRFFHPAEQER